MSQALAENKIFLCPGEFWFGSDHINVHTLLGSCIAITLWHPKKKIGGMCHFVLPKRPKHEKCPAPDGRYGDEAMELFRRATFETGTQLSEYEGKIFGGSNMLSVGSGSDEDLIGTRNAEVAMQMVMVAGVDLAVVHVGESGHRRIVFEVATGAVWVKHANDSGNTMDSTSGLS